MTWQTIDTAPKDGQRVLLLGTFDERGIMAQMKWSPQEQVGRWFTSNNTEHGGWWTVMALPFTPTHWMPLTSASPNHQRAVE
jgi:hypothetical protein